MNGIQSLNAGAPDLRLTGDQRPQEDNIRVKIKQIAEQSGHPESFPATDSDFAALAQLSDSPNDFPSTDYDFEVILRIAKEPIFAAPEKSKAETYANYMAQGGRIGFQWGGPPGGGETAHGSGAAVGTGSGFGTGSGYGGAHHEQNVTAPYKTTIVQPSVETRVSPGQSMAMVGNTSLAGATQSQAASVMAAASEAEGVDTIEDIIAARPKIESVIGAPSGLSDVTPAQADLLAGIKTGDASRAEDYITIGRRDVEDSGYYDTLTGRQELLDMQQNIADTRPTITQGGEGEGPIVTDTTSTVPIETLEDTGLTPEEDAAAVAALDYGTTFPTEIGELPYDIAGQRDLSHLIDPRMKRDYAENIQLMTAADGGRAGYDRGGIAGIRQPFFIGKAVKKLVGGAKKVLKSPIGKAALLGIAGFGIPGTGFKGLMGSNFLKTALAKGTHHADPGWLRKGLNFLKTPTGAMTAITALSSVPLWARPENWDEMDQAEQEAWLKDYHSKVASYKEQYGGDMPVQLTKAADLPYQFAAEGGRIGLANGRTIREAALQAMYDEDEEENTGTYVQKRKGIMAAAQGGRIGYRYGKTYKDKTDREKLGTALRKDDIIGLEPYFDLPYEELMALLKGIRPSRKKERSRKQEGGLMDLGGMEKDYRQEGGFVPLGGEEKADDVPARLSKNEFVFTTDAVRAAGGGDVDAGAEVMENVMENLEAGGRISEESQGLEGARNMFANAQELEKRII